ncbi:MAG: hypothetical protein B6242_08860 [Anaerolineaceae bacterium 4572_78]|nr:MAG: hypothetical protein B6242_08860 [Anaerolineaceae bacterium 4572_78]
MNTKRFLSPHIQITTLLVIVLLIGLYNVLRYGGLSGETDTHVFTEAIRTIQVTGELISSRTGDTIYPNGYSFQSLAVFLTNLTGISLATLQIYGGSLLAIWIIFPAWLFYRELLDSPQGATLATILLFIQPELLFGILRGSHEKFTRGLMLMCLYLLIRSLRSQKGSSSQSFGFIIAFYIAGYGMITFNNLFAFSFTIAILLSLGFSWIILRLYAEALQSKTIFLARSALVVFNLLILAFIFTFYIYEPAQDNISVLSSVVDKVAVLILDFEHTSSLNPYITITTAWINLPTYVIVSLANWVTLMASIAIATWYFICWTRGNKRPQKETELLLWGLYVAFVMQGILSIVIDISGALANNLQHRIFPSFVMFAVPVITKFLIEWQPKQIIIRRLLYTGVGMLVGVLAILSILKATNEPLLSNKWIFHTHGEIHAIDWADQRLGNEGLWLGYDDRLYTGYGIQNDINLIVAQTPNGTQLDWGDQYPNTRNYLVSDIIRNQGIRFNSSLPFNADSLCVFDNGETQIYHNRPRTPYQK